MRPTSKALATSWPFERFIFRDYLSRTRRASPSTRPDKDRPETRDQLAARLLAAARTAGGSPLARPGPPALMREVRARIEARNAVRKKWRRFKRIIGDVLRPLAPARNGGQS